MLRRLLPNGITRRALYAVIHCFAVGNGSLTHSHEPHETYNATDSSPQSSTLRPFRQRIDLPALSLGRSRLHASMHENRGKEIYHTPNGTGMADRAVEVTTSFKNERKIAAN